MRRIGARVLAGLIAATLLAALAPGVPAQGGFGRGRPGQGGGRGQATQPAPRDQPAPGEYSFDADQVLEAINRGEGRPALAYYERTAAQATERGDHMLVARANGAAAAVALRLGLFQTAIRSGTRAIELFKGQSLAPADVGRLASVYPQVGGAYRMVGDLVQARQVLEEGIGFVGSQMRGRREEGRLAVLSRSLASVASAQRDYPTAVTRAGQAAQFFEDAVAQLPPRAPDRRRTNLRRQAALALVVLGRAQLVLGHPEEAEAAFDRARKHAQATGLREVELEVVRSHGDLALSRQDWSKALNLFRKGVALANQINRTGALMWLQQGVARALDGLGRIDEALAAAREAVRSVEELRGNLDESELRGGFLEDKQKIYQHAVRLALRAGHPDEAFALAERSRARAFLDLLGNQTRLSKGRTRGLIDEELRLRAQMAEAQARVQEAGEPEESEDARALIEAADREYRAFLDRVRKESPEQASLMTVEPVTLPEIQSLLPEGTTLLEYLVGERDVIAWVVDRQHATVVRMPGDRAALVAQVRRFRAAIADQASLADVEAQAQALYRELLAPARGEIRGDRLLIVPHDVLHYLPFAALRAPQGRWLTEEYTVAILPSASVLQYLGGKAAGASSNPRALAVGNPDLGSGLGLRWAEREARVVGDRFPGSWVLLRGQATKARAEALSGQAGLLHFATHGEFNEQDPLASALLLTPDGSDSGRLTVRDIFGLDLGARLAVLSACETGLGRLSRGDELVGLQRAFLYAGTPAVVTTLWKVDDRASFLLMREFYTQLGSVDAATALRAAQGAVMREFPHPFAWAAFGLTGVGG